MPRLGRDNEEKIDLYAVEKLNPVWKNFSWLMFYP